MLEAVVGCAIAAILLLAVLDLEITAMRLFRRDQVQFSHAYLASPAIDWIGRDVRSAVSVTVPHHGHMVIATKSGDVVEYHVASDTLVRTQGGDRRVTARYVRSVQFVMEDDRTVWVRIEPDMADGRPIRFESRFVLRQR